MRHDELVGEVLVLQPQFSKSVFSQAQQAWKSLGYWEVSLPMAGSGLDDV